jgi:hypothetical protein
MSDKMNELLDGLKLIHQDKNPRPEFDPDDVVSFDQLKKLYDEDMYYWDKMIRNYIYRLENVHKKESICFPIIFNMIMKRPITLQDKGVAVIGNKLLRRYLGKPHAGWMGTRRTGTYRQYNNVYNVKKGYRITYKPPVSLRLRIEWNEDNFAGITHKKTWGGTSKRNITKNKGVTKGRGRTIYFPEPNFLPVSKDSEEQPLSDGSVRLV